MGRFGDLNEFLILADLRRNRADCSRPETLLHFVSSHLELKNSLEQAKAEMEEAFKAARAEARKKSGSQITKKDSAGNCNKPA